MAPPLPTLDPFVPPLDVGRPTPEATKAFLTEGATWTQDVREAADFPDQSRIHQLKQELKLNNIELYHLFGDQPNPQYDFALGL